MKVFSREEWQILRYANLCWIYKTALKAKKIKQTQKKKNKQF